MSTLFDPFYNGNTLRTILKARDLILDEDFNDMVRNYAKTVSFEEPQRCLYSTRSISVRETKNGKVEVLITNIGEGKCNYIVNGKKFNLYIESVTGIDGNKCTACCIMSETLPKEVDENSAKIYCNKKTKELKIVFEPAKPKPEEEDKFVEIEVKDGSFKL